jgi:hypothetical protein
MPLIINVGLSKKVGLRFEGRGPHRHVSEEILIY